MAEFIGTKKEFHKYFGPRFRNIVQFLTKKYRKTIGKCEICGAETNLESAHIKGRGRVRIIETILSKYYINDNYRVDLDEFEKSFILEHKEINNVIRILCKDCHYKYDENPRKETILAKPNIIKAANPNRLFSNMEIQHLILTKLKNYREVDLQKFLDKNYCKQTFNLNYPLLIKAPKQISHDVKRELIKDKGKSRWSWKYEFEMGDYVYAICTQWYTWNDDYVKKWINTDEDIS